MKNTTKTADLATTYRLPTLTAPENLEMRFSDMDGKTLTFGNFTLYAFTTTDHTCEGEVKLVKVSCDRFEDDGHAIAWAISEAH